MVKLLVGILKGAVIGGALGYGAYALHIDDVLVIYGVIGAIIGLFVGKPIWSLITDKTATTWVAVLKSVFGFGIGCGLYALVARAWQPSLSISTIPNVFAWGPTLGGAIGAIYGGFVELDDAIGDDKSAAKQQKDPPQKKLPAKKG